MTVKNEMTLPMLMKMQRQLMDLLGLPKAVSLNSPHIREALLMLVEEIGETYRELPSISKPWRPQDGMARTRVEEESVDLLFFVLELFNLLGLSAEDVSSIYQKKQEELKLRIRQKNLGERKVNESATN